MAQYTNSTPNFNDWNFYFPPFPYSEGLIVFLILLYRMKTQLQKPKRQRNIKLIQEFQRRVVHLLNTLMNWCARMQDFDDTHIKKHVINVKVVPYENNTIVKLEKKKEDKHPWDIAQEIILEKKQAALAVKWAVLPLEVLMDEQFLTILHAIEGITNATPLKEAAKQLPKQIYKIIKSQEQLIRIPAELMDQLVFDVSNTYYYSIIESLCKLIKSIQQGQRTTLVSLAKIVQDQRDEIEKYQTLLKLPEEVRQLQLRMEKLKKHVNTHLERIDKKTSVTSVTVSKIGLKCIDLKLLWKEILSIYQSQINLPGCSLVTLLSYTLRRMISYFKSVMDRCLPIVINNERKTQPQVESYQRSRTIYPMG